MSSKNSVVPPPPSGLARGSSGEMGTAALSLRSSSELGTGPPLVALLCAPGHGPGFLWCRGPAQFFPRCPSSPRWLQRLPPRALRVREADGPLMSGFVVSHPKGGLLEAVGTPGCGQRVRLSSVSQPFPLPLPCPDYYRQERLGVKAGS